MKERKLAASLFFVVGTFILCWIPYAVGYVVRKYLYSRKTWDLFLRLRVWSMTLGYSNSSMNVFIYSRHNKQIRRAMVSLFRRSTISPERISASGSDDVFVMTKIKRDISQQQTWYELSLENWILNSLNKLLLKAQPLKETQSVFHLCGFTVNSIYIFTAWWHMGVWNGSHPCSLGNRLDYEHESFARCQSQWGDTTSEKSSNNTCD